MRRTYAPTGVMLGILIGFAASAKTGSNVTGVIVAVVASVLLWVGIRWLENLLAKGVDKASDAIMNKYEDSKNKH